MRSGLRNAIERANYFVNQESLSSSSSSQRADMEFDCTADGANVAIVDIGTVSTLTFVGIRNAAFLAGYQLPRDKVLIFVDAVDPTGKTCGMGDHEDDERRTVENYNNGGRLSTMYALVWKNCWYGRTPLHEATHMMGGAQNSAPHTSGHHVTDGQDVMQNEDLPAFEADHCVHMRYDCGKDTYFDTNTQSGSWLHTHWNIGWNQNRYIYIRP